MRKVENSNAPRASPQKRSQHWPQHEVINCCEIAWNFIAPLVEVQRVEITRATGSMEPERSERERESLIVLFVLTVYTNNIQ